MYSRRKVGTLLKSSYDISFTIWTFWKPATPQDIIWEKIGISWENTMWKRYSSIRKAQHICIIWFLDDSAFIFWLLLSLSIFHPSYPCILSTPVILGHFKAQVPSRDCCSMRRHIPMSNVQCHFRQFQCPTWNVTSIKRYSSIPMSKRAARLYFRRFKPSQYHPYWSKQSNGYFFNI